MSCKISFEQEVLIRDNIKLAYWLANKWHKKIGDYSIKDGLISAAELGLIKAARKWKSDKGTKFTTFAITCMNNQIKIFLRRNAKKPVSFSEIEKNISNDDNVKLENYSSQLQTIDDKVEKISLMQCIEKLSKKESKVLISYYFNGKSQSSIATDMHISQAYVSRIMNTGLKKIRQFY